MPEERRISPLVIVGIGAGIATAVTVGLYAWARAAPSPPPGGYTCPYCGAPFDTYEELAYHVQSEHPGERIPLPIEWE